MADIRDVESLRNYLFRKADDDNTNNPYKIAKLRAYQDAFERLLASPVITAEPKHYDTESWKTTTTEESSEYAPVKHGRWIKNEGRSGWHCSCCGKDDLYAYPYTQNNERELQDFYCPNCGAKMDEV